MNRQLCHVLFWTALLGIGCDVGAVNDGGNDGVEDDPVVMVGADDPQIEAATQKARDTVGEFIAALENPKAGQDSFAVKMKFVDGDQVEFMWLTDLTHKDGQFHGTLNNDPQLVSNVRIGDARSVAASEISDWMYMEGGEMVGGYTVEVLLRRQNTE